MKYLRLLTYRPVRRIRFALLLLQLPNLLGGSLTATAQIVIGGSVYGGGNEGDLGGKTTVTVYSGDLNMVYGGARMADVGGNAFVNIDGANASGNILINKVFGGNDISGSIGTELANKDFLVPTGTDELDGDSVSKFSITKQWQAFVRTSPTPDGKSMFIGQLYGGGNGETKVAGKDSPDIDLTYMEVKGGTIGHVFGGGNNATVTTNTTIYIDNKSPVVTSIRDAEGVDILDNANNSTDEAKQKALQRLKAMGLNTSQTNTTSTDFQFARVFGGNNKADMAISPTWYLRRGKIRDLYSGGNEGSMTYQRGLLLTLDASEPNAVKDASGVLRVGNVYGGCRMADVHPLDDNGDDVDNDEVQLSPNPSKFPAGFAARVRVLGGWIENVYGGNDISGDVYGGNAIDIYTTVHGNVYGGGNGSYAYTDNASLKDDELWGDYYYDPDKVLADKKMTATSEDFKSVEALNAFRPNAEQVSIHIHGTEDKRTVIEKALYIGSNSATLTELTEIDERKVELKIGSYCYVDSVFLGNNGVNMIDASVNGVLVKYAGNVTDADYDEGGTAEEKAAHTHDFSTLDLTDQTTPGIFSKYMEGCAMRIIPSITFDTTPRDQENYVAHSTYIGSFYCGGNVGSMIFDEIDEDDPTAKPTTIDFDHEVVIFDKLVGGCNNANVPAHTGLNARYEGGFMTLKSDGTIAEGPSVGGSETIADKLILNLSNLRIEPKRWIGTKDDDGNYTSYSLDSNGNRQLEWNTINAAGDETPPTTLPAANAAGKRVSPADLNRRLKGGNIYGGCYSSGHIDGNVVININGTILDRWSIFDKVTSGSDKLYVNIQNNDFDITERHSGVLLDAQGMDPLGLALNVFGGGYGAETEIWGSTSINLTQGYAFQIFGGSEQGAIGRGTWNSSEGKYEYAITYDPRFSTYINLDGTVTGAPRTADEDVTTSTMAAAEFVYGGGFEGPILGDTHVYLGNGRVFNTFAGSDNADIWGHTETYIGRNRAGVAGFPWVRDHTYGGNDLGGRIWNRGYADFTGRVNTDYLGSVHGYSVPEGATSGSSPVLTASAYTEYVQGHVDYIFGGCYGDYNYDEGGAYSSYTAPRMDNAFVNFKANTYGNNSVNKIFGAGQGAAKFNLSAKNEMQDRSYVLIDVEETGERFDNLEVFGAGQNCGVGMGVAKATADVNSDGLTAAAVIDLARGQIGAAYGGSLNEGVTRRAIVNVPTNSIIKIGSIFAGAYGSDIYLPCDVYEGVVNYHSTSDNAYLIYNTDKELMKGAIYGGNNWKRRTLYGKINIDVPVRQLRGSDKSLATIYGAGYGSSTWNEYTEVNLNSGASVWEVYGGGEAGGVMSAESVERYIKSSMPSTDEDGKPLTRARWRAAWTLGSGYDPTTFDIPDEGDIDIDYVDNRATNLENTLVREAEIDDRDYTGYDDDAKARIYKRYNTNVIISEGATVNNYAYGGGLGKGTDTFKGSGDVYGTTYIALLGGTVKKDIYAAGTNGAVYDLFRAQAYDKTDNPKGFTASSNAYIKGGTCRNVYGGGWAGAVGYHKFERKTRYNEKFEEELYFDYWVDPSTTTDISGETHVVIGDLNGTSLTNGIPAIERNAYGGGEGGPVFGTANITLNKGYIGYRYFANKAAAVADHVAFANTPRHATADPAIVPDGISDGGGYYQEKLHDETWDKGDGTDRLYDSGCIFGGGYVDNSNVDVTNVNMYGGIVRNALFGGGEIAAIGRGLIKASGEKNSVRELQGIFKAGKASVTLWKGHVRRNVFGGGRGYNNLGEGGTLYSDGYVFGQTEANIFGGEVGTEAGIEIIDGKGGDGNVFGGGDIGFVYSAYTNDSGQLCFGRKSGARYDSNEDTGTQGDEGYYYRHEGGSYVKSGDSYTFSGGHFVNASGEDISSESVTDKEKILTEDCKVLVEPHCQATAAVTVNGHNYAKGDYIPDSVLNTLKNKNASSEWNSIDPAGIIIHNAVFAGGNTSSGSASVYANTTTVFGNATAAIQDIYHRDLITLGTGHTGGLYGDGNLTFVDGFRGLNITNYGTDYYSIDEEITLTQYENLPAREAAYYELKYKCMQECTDDDGTTYHPKDESDTNSKASTLTADDILSLFKNGTNTSGVITTGTDGKKVPNPAYWTENGVLPVYAGRPMNTIQRADFCGVFGSRMVMQGAQDRVPEITDFTNYTINRVREVSLNKVISPAGDTEDNKKDYLHGNYFGIYSVVNFLGALTSDLDFGADGTTGEHPDVGTGDPRTTDNTDVATYGPKYEGQTFFGWKKAHVNDRLRNNGSSHNKVALASGVYLELTTEKGTGEGLYEKDWGYITGVIELDLINVQTGIGGGFVYARNVHGKRSATGRTHATTTLNRDAVTNKKFKYDLSDDDGHKHEWQTSGNFVRSSSTNPIIDDCYNISGKYKSQYKQPDGVPAHYWYIKGQVYVYDQYISAYTGSPNAYSEKVDIPLTITAASHGTMKLLNVQPNYYAYKNTAGDPLGDGQKLVINDITYYKNDPIDYWTYSLLNAAEKNLFVAQTYIVKEDCKIGADKYSEGQVLSDEEYNQLTSNGTSKPTVTQEYVDDEDGKTKTKVVDFDYIFRSSNNLSHDTGYILTYKVNNPTGWDTWYTEKADSQNDSSKPHEKNLTGGVDYEDGPTYRLKVSTGGEVLGQLSYKEGNIIAKSIYDTYNAIPSDVKSSLTDQAEFGPAYIVTTEVTDASGTWFPGSTVPATTAATLAGHVETAYVCTRTIQLSPTEYIYLGDKMSASERSALLTTYADNAALKSAIEEDVVPAYICTSEGKYGGNYFEAGKNYRARDAWPSMSSDDRQMFTFNYDALDLLIDPTYSRAPGLKYQYDADIPATANVADAKALAEANEAKYSFEQPVDYTASYNPKSNPDGTFPTLSVSPGVTLKRNGATMTNQGVILKDDELDRTVFESLHNEQRHYAAINVKTSGTYYVVKEAFQVGSSPYAVGTTITSASYGALSNEDQAKIAKLIFTESQANTDYYFCRDAYTISSSESLGVPVTALSGVYDSDGVSGSYSRGATVPVGAVIAKTEYDQLVAKNQQKDFIIHGIAPTETSTFYVSRNSDIADLSKEKIITVVYQYEYDENDASGNITPISERHVVNIHITFKSGVPSIEDIKAPQIVLPGSRLVMQEPHVTPGAHEVTGGGWELFQKKSEAESHDNGAAYSPLSDKLFYYQNDYYLAYYATTYLGKTYSNAVPVKVANYHDLAAVMGDKENHYFIDHQDVDRQPKIYINDYTTNDPATSQSGIDLLRNLISLSHKEPETDPETSEIIPFSSGSLKDHMPLDLTHTEKPMRGGEYLEFFLRADQNYTGSWTPIADADGECFSGTLHGDGHTINGLDNSLFNHLCGDVYNLGVTGSFTGAGVAETGEGYVENCWISTTSTAAKTSKPVFGDPSRLEGDSKGLIQIVNSYYEEEDNASPKYAVHSGTHGTVTRKPARSFYNGEVAYDLNGFYLNKRYWDHSAGLLGSSPTEYQFYQLDASGKVPTVTVAEKTNSVPSTGKYPASPVAKYGDIGYVEDRFKDGDFIYAGGSIPETADERLYTDADGNTHYYPIWPDDYLFFGQRLTYGHEVTRPHQPKPSYINKSGNRLATTSTSVNRVYRSPAYFRSKEMGVAHYNPYAVFAAKSADGAHEAYPGMTAIDFTGGNGDVSGGYVQGGDSKFYPPLLDNDGLTNFRSDIDLTKNLLVYTHPQASSTSEDANSKTYRAVNSALENEPTYSETDAAYRTVAAVTNTTYIYGHHVVSTGDGNYQARRDHFLVDKQDFNAPIEYSFASGKRMWYQRTPDLYVNRTKGWEGVSLPFAAELVTTQRKGEITHFYDGSNESLNDPHSKIGHEYWLREFGEGGTPSSTDANVFEAAFNYPTSAPTGDDALPTDKNYSNTFLWDYYYSQSARQDANRDIYQEYYRNGHTHNGYDYADRAKPYIIGFPGTTYYEFDLSGEWTPEGTFSSITSPGKQVITFASKTGAKIHVSDDEQLSADAANNHDGYVFKSNYLKQTFAAGTANTYYTLNGEGSSFDLIPTSGADVDVQPFRPYFTATPSPARPVTTRSIIFRQNESQLGGGDDPGQRDEEGASLSISSKRHKIIVTSALREATDIRIVSVSGITIAAYTIEPGETVETRVNNSGVYIVRTADSRYLKKLAVR